MRTKYYLSVEQRKTLITSLYATKGNYEKAMKEHVDSKGVGQVSEILEQAIQEVDELIRLFKIEESEL